MHHRPFQQVDVFTATAYRGNPLAVVLDGTDLSTEEMQQFTRWTNLSEATFVLPPTPEGRAAGADYRVRIFYPAGELPFAGHPTLGTCHAWLKAGGQPRVAGRGGEECGGGVGDVGGLGGLVAVGGGGGRGGGGGGGGGGGVAGEGGGGGAGAGADQRLSKVTLAGALALNEDFWSRPELRLYVTKANWNQAAAVANAATFGANGKTSRTLVGVQYEVWW